ncbi:MAG: hypothetical protein EX271_07495 [Acidimicrobiales bacterium]|nr:hypothetical protein [Hyphomonadaceae bacterium]RZV41684.1 MAG: hypothetical protein EX271_07495 [Acidimicrobiales bacterium]
MSAPPIKKFRSFISIGPELYDECRQFYTDLGFEKLWDDGETVCEFHTGSADQTFLLTVHYGLKRPIRGVYQLWVDDVDGWYDHVKSLDLKNKPYEADFSEPSIQPWGWNIFYVWDPNGTLLHIGQPVDPDQTVG